MPYEIETKDGIVIRGIPDDIPPDHPSVKVRVARARGQSKPAPMPQAPTADTAELIAGSVPGRLALGAASPFLGAAQLAANAVGLGKPVNEHLQQLEAMKQQGMKAYETEGLDLAGMLGTALSPAFLGAAGAIPKVAGYLPKVGVGAGLGALAGATAPVVTEGNFATEKLGQVASGAGLGALLPAIAPVVTGPAKAVYNSAIEPWLNPAGIKGRTLLDAAGPKAQQIMALLQANKQIVPGSAPTAGEAAAAAASPEFSALQAAAARVAPGPYLERADAQNAARIAALQSVGKDKAALEVAQIARGATASVNYGAASKIVVKADDTLNDLLQRPSMSKIVSRAEDLAKERGLPFKVGDSYPAESLHYVKMAMDDLIKNPERFGMGASEVNAISRTRGQFLNWFSKKVPEYDFARTEFAKASVPINQMEVGQFLEGKLVPALSDEARQRSGVYAQALRDAPGTIKRATGNARFEELSQVLTPQQTQTVLAVRDDLARATRTDLMARLGSDATPEIRELAVIGRIPNPLQANIALANRLINKLEGKINKKVAAELAAEMLNPPQAAQTMAQALKRVQRNNFIAAKTAQLVGTKNAGSAVTTGIIGVSQRRDE